MKTWHFYDPATGIFSSQSYSGPESGLASNTPRGFVPREGRVDFRKQRRDLESGSLVDHQREPDAGYLSRRELAKTLAQLRALDSKLVRPMAELMLDGGNDAARARLVEIENQKTELRAKLIETETSAPQSKSR